MGMARPRKYVQDASGKTVDGLSFHKSSRSYYSLGKDGQRAWFGRDRERAIQAYRASLGQTMVRPITDKEALDRLAWEGVEEDQVTPELIASQKRGRIGIRNEWVDANPDKPLAVFVRTGKYPREPKPASDPVSKERLRDCFQAWASWSQEETLPQTILDTRRFFDRFVDAVGNLPANQITHEHFVKWQQAVKKRCKNLSPKSVGDHHAAVAKVLRFAKRKHRNWAFPDGLMEWLDDWKLDKRTPYVPKKSNSQPMPVDVYKGLLRVADAWAVTELPPCTAGSGSAAAKRRQAQLRQRQGVQFSAVLKLAIHGLANIDCARIEWSDLQLDGALPYFDFPRTKSQHKTGYAIDRKTPLLPATVAALKRWRRFEQPNTNVFRTSQKRPFSTNSLWQVIEKMRDKSDGNGWSFKHLRNIGGTLGDKGGLSEMMIDRFLGHTLKRERAKYLGDVDASYLVPLVNLIGAEYFDGETVA